MHILQSLLIPGLVGKLWPPERALMGLRVCRWMQVQLVAHIEMALVCGPCMRFSQRPKSRDYEAQDICSTLSKLRNCKVVLVWNSRRHQTTPLLLDGIIAAIANGFGKKLTQLTLNSTKIWDTNSQKLATVIAGCSALKRLDLSVIGINQTGMEQLSEALGRCTELEHLELGWNKVRSEGASKLAEALQNCTSLIHLGLAGNNIGDSGICVLASALQSCTALTHLILPSNQLGAHGVSKLAAILSDLQSLAILDLSRNQLGAEGSFELSRGLARSLSLTNLDLYKCDVTVAHLAPALECCTALTHLELGDNTVGAEGAGTTHLFSPPPP